MIPPAPNEPLRGPPVNARIIVSPAGMPPLILTETERCPCLFTPVPTHTEHLGRFFGLEACQVHQFDHCPVGGGQRGQPGDQRPASAFGIDPVDQRRDCRDEGVRGQVGHSLRVRAAPREIGGDRRHVRPVQRLELSNAISRPALLRRPA